MDERDLLPRAVLVKSPGLANDAVAPAVLFADDLLVDAVRVEALTANDPVADALDDDALSVDSLVTDCVVCGGDGGNWSWSASLMSQVEALKCSSRFDRVKYTSLTSLLLQICRKMSRLVPYLFRGSSAQ